MAYQTHIQMQEDSEEHLNWLIQQANNLQDRDEEERDALEDFIVNDQPPLRAPESDHEDPPERHVHDVKLVLKDLGYLCKVTLKEESKDIKLLIPDVAFFANRGNQLRDLSRYEYAALVELKDRTEEGGKRATEFPFGEGFICKAHKAQFLRAKQHTVLVIRKPPHHPGTEPPTSSRSHPKWLEKADRYARFYLTLFRPEPNCYKPSHENTYEYTWKALEEFVTQLQHDDCILSKFWLMAMHTQMKGFLTSFKNRLMLSKFRGRNRKMWNEKEQQEWEVCRAWQAREQRIDNPLDDYLYSVNNSTLNLETNRSINASLKATSKLSSCFQKTSAFSSSRQKKKAPLSTTTTKDIVFKGNSGEVQFKGTSLRKFDKEEAPHLQSEHQRTYYSGTSKKRRRALHQRTVRDMKTRQLWVYRAYKKYLDNPDDPKHAPPDITLLHGTAGTGKTTVMDTILDYADLKAHSTVQTAFNAINAIHFKQGQTTASLIHLTGVDKEILRGMKPTELKAFAEIIGPAILIFLDELSNIAPWHLAKFSYSCQQAMETTTSHLVARKCCAVETSTNLDQFLQVHPLQKLSWTCARMYGAVNILPMLRNVQQNAAGNPSPNTGQTDMAPTSSFGRSISHSPYEIH